MSTIEQNAPSVVVGFDDSPSGFDAVALGRLLASVMQARLIVANVYPLNAIGTTDVALDSDIGERMRAEAVETVQRARFVLEGFDAYETVAYAAVPPARGLHEVAERAGAEIIVAGSTHRHGLGLVMPGSTAERLLHGSGFPIAVAPAGWRGDRLRTIGVGFDGSGEARAALASAFVLARASGAGLRVVTAFERPHPANPAYAVTVHGYTEIMRDLREGHEHRLSEAVGGVPEGCECDWEVVDGRAADVLAAESADLDLLIIGSRAYGALHATLTGSVGHELAWRARCPLLLVPRGVEHPLAGLRERVSSAS